MQKTNLLLCIISLYLCFFMLTSCNNTSKQNELLLKTWKLNDAKEGKQALFASNEGTTFRFMNENKLEIKRTYRGNAEYLRGNFQMKNTKMNSYTVKNVTGDGQTLISYARF